jgi:hypothetical protein
VKLVIYLFSLSSFLLFCAKRGSYKSWNHLFFIRAML